MRLQKMLHSWRSVFGLHRLTRKLAEEKSTMCVYWHKTVRCIDSHQLAICSLNHIVTLQAIFGGGSSSFRRFLETKLAAPAVSELFAGSTATHILPATLRCGPQPCSVHPALGET
jgi:hypothetical protein